METRLHIIQIMGISILRQWDTFWCSERKLIWSNLLLALNESYLKGPVVYYLREKPAGGKGGRGGGGGGAAILLDVHFQTLDF